MSLYQSIVMDMIEKASELHKSPVPIKYASDPVKISFEGVNDIEDYDDEKIHTGRSL